MYIQDMDLRQREALLARAAHPYYGRSTSHLHGCYHTHGVLRASKLVAQLAAGIVIIDRVGAMSSTHAFASQTKSGEQPQTQWEEESCSVSDESDAELPQTSS